MNTIKLNYLTVFLLVTTILLAGCEKETDFNNKNSEVLKFESYDDFIKAYKTILALTTEERFAWEKMNGYSSFGSKCDEIYFAIDPDKFQTQEEVFAFVEKNSDYLQLIEEENGEWTLETKLYQNPLRYFANEEMMFQIGEDMVKVFETSSLKAKLNKKGQLKTLQSLINDDGTGEFSTFFVIHPLNNTKDAAHNCGTTPDPARKTEGSERIYLRISMERFSLHGGPMVQSSYMVRPYYRVAGIWYWTTRHLACDLNVKVAIWTDSGLGWHTQTGSYTNTGENARSLSGILTEYWPNTFGSFHFDAYNCWATQTQVTEVARLECNKHLLD